uniref:TCP domain-containing protein n=1 Tax=Oryza brachyantha TaxID=4533 RepID=J3L471_ORYBR
MRNAKAAIDELPDRAEGPPPQPAATTEQPEATEQVTSTSYGFGNTGAGAMTSAASAGSFLPHSLGADRVSDNVKSLFPSSSTAATAPPAAGHDEYRESPPDLLSRTTSSQPQELCLTLQSNQHQIFSHVSANQHHGMISSAGVPGWPDHVQRMPSWHAPENSTGDGRGAGGNGDSYMFAMPARQGLDQGQLFAHGEPLQSSSSGWASARTWLDPLAVAAIHHQSSTMAAGQVGFGHLVGGGGGGFMGFLAPAAQRLQGEEEHGGEAMRRD